MNKDKNKRKKNLRASISIMLSLVMLPVYTFAGMAADRVRASSARQVTENAIELSMNSALASYDDALKSTYGLFVMSENEEDLTENLEKYFNANIEHTSIFDDEKTDQYGNLINLTPENFEIKFPEGAVLANPVVLKNQIVEYMKYIGPVRAGKGLIDKLGVFKDFKNQSNMLKAKSEYDKSLGNIQDLCIKIKKNAYAYNQLISTSHTITEDVEEIKNNYYVVAQQLFMLASQSLPENEANKLVESINSSCKNTADLVCGWFERSESALEYLEEVQDALSKIEDSISLSESKRKIFGDSISALEDGELKNTMQSEYDNNSSYPDMNSVREYAAVTSENIEAFKALREDIFNFSFYNTKIYEYIDYCSCYISSIPLSEPFEADKLLKCTLSDNTLAIKQQGNEYDFYKFVSESYQSDETTSKDLSGSLSDIISSFGEIKKILNIELPEGTPASINDKISSDTLSKVKKYADFTISDTYDISEQSEDIIENTSSYLKNIGELISSAGENLMEDIYITDYITSMFSCYTCDKTASSISGVPINSKNNVFYKSEAEYILWGNNDMKKNHQYTNSLIFGIRFVFNNIYAFTDSKIQSSVLTASSVVAGWTGLGVPLVKTALTMAIAFSESINDVNEILSGEAIPIIKNSSTWKTDPSSILKKTVNGPVNSEFSDKKSDEAQANGPTLTYKEYLMLFILLNTMNENSERAILSRTALMIQANMTDGLKDTEYGRSGDFDITNSSSMVLVNADVKMNTWFMNIQEGNKEKNISCSGILSY